MLNIVPMRVPSQEVKTLRDVENHVSGKPHLFPYFLSLFYGILLTAPVIKAFHHVKNSHPI